MDTDAYNSALSSLVACLLEVKPGWGIDYNDMTDKTGLSQSDIIELATAINKGLGEGTITMSKSDVMLNSNRIMLSSALENGKIVDLISGKLNSSANYTTVNVGNNSGVINQNTGDQSLRDLESNLKTGKYSTPIKNTKAIFQNTGSTTKSGKGTFTKFTNIIWTLIIGLLIAYLTYRFGWN